MASKGALHPSLTVPIGHVEPVPRRIRGMIGSRVAFDTRHALYVWEWRAHPQFSIPIEDLVEGVLHDDEHTEQLGAGPAHRHPLHVGPEVRTGEAWIWGRRPASPARHRAFRVGALDSWFEEDEPIFFIRAARTPAWTLCVPAARSEWSWTAPCWRKRPTA
ncbi:MULTISPECIES: hypothetical protein [unclassified Nocardiopsis]|uniref:hypothetical protein n=1 Tax=unclassified Nocardiopsis TaxID=2649073 RepID=UPI001915DF31|nr:MULTISPECIES: hypothetical protein [unclassified Nocardiopsis]